MVDFIGRLDEVGILYCLASIFVYIAYLRIELISKVIFICCSLPLAIERFSSYQLHLCLDVSMYNTAVLENQMSLRIFDTHLGA
jgi:hypothetical protein